MADSDVPGPLGSFVQQRRLYVVALATVALTVAISYHIMSQKPPTVVEKTARPKRQMALRIEGVPKETSLDALKDHLQSIGQRANVDAITRHTLVRKNLTEACASAIFCSSVPQAELLRKLNQASEELNFSYRFDSKFLGITPLYEVKGEETVDIVAVPGLASHPIGSWKSSSNSDVWLRDYLPTDLPHTRVLLYGYDTTLLNSDSRKSIEDMGRMLLASIAAFRNGDGTNRRPIVFIGHSLGGLLIKEALIEAKKRNSGLDVFKACCGLVFFGVPNYGLRNEQLQTIVEGQPNEALIRDLVVDDDSEPSRFLKRISEQFAESLGGHCPMVCFYETRRSPTVEMSSDGVLRKTGPKSFMVTLQSATTTGATAATGQRNFPVDADHSGLVKFDSRSQDEYMIVKEELKTLATDGKALVKARFEDKLTPEEKAAWKNLNQPPYSAFRNSRKLQKPEHGTLQWLVDTTPDAYARHETDDDEKTLRAHDFISWRDSPGPAALLVEAPPGRGKSVLSNFILEHLESRASKDTRVIYYFCNIRNDETLPDAKSVLRSLIVQLCETRPALFRTLPFEWVKSRQEFRSAALQTLLHTFEQMLQHGSFSRVYCVIDGLDVYQDPAIPEIVTGIRDILDGSNNRPSMKTILNLLCTTRPYTHIINSWNPAPTRKLRCNRDDILKFIERRVASLDESFPSHLKSVISEELLSRTEQTFLWLDVVIRRVGNLEWVTMNAVKDEIAQSSEELYELYEDLVQRATKKTEMTARILALVVYAKRPLRCEELQDAVAINPTTNKSKRYQDCLNDMPTLDAENINRVLGTLLDVVEGSVYVIHQSVRDFFETKQPLNGFLGGISSKLFPAFVSMTYLSLGDIKNPPDGYPFYTYAAGYWYRHLESASDVYGHAPLQVLLRKLLVHSRAWRNYDPLHHISEKDQILSKSKLAMDLDIGWLVELLLDKKLDGFSDEFDRNSLSVAAKGKKESVLKVLLSRGAETQFAFSQDVVKSIARSHTVDVMKLLLDKRGKEIRITPEVVEAAIRNLQGVDTIKLLLDERGGEIHLTPEVVRAAASNPQGMSAMTFLLERPSIGVRITPDMVRAASGDNWEDILEMLFTERGEEIEMTPEVFAKASRSGDGRLIKLLLEKHEGQPITADMLIALIGPHDWERTLKLVIHECTGTVDISPSVLAAAARSGDLGTMKFLVRECKYKVRISPDMLIAAANNKRHASAVMEFLLVRAGTNTCITPGVASAAARSSRHGDELMKLLLEKEPGIIHMRDENGWTPLGAACDKGLASTVELLVAHGADPHDTNVSPIGYTPLALASKSGSFFAVALLLRKGVDISKRYDGGWTAFSLAVSKGYLKIVELLLRAGADPNECTDDGLSAIMSTCLSQNRPMLKKLLTYSPARVNTHKRHPTTGITMLMCAAATGHSEFLEMILDRPGANADAKDITGRTALFWAANNGRQDVVGTLLRHDPAVCDWADSFGTTPLAAAARKGHRDVVQLLLKVGKANADTPDRFGRTALWWARRERHKGVVRLLVGVPAKSGQSPDGSYSLVASAARQAEYSQQATYCGICTLHIPDGTMFRFCKLCGGGFSTCQACFDLGGRCLQDSHNLTEARNEKPLKGL